MRATPSPQQNPESQFQCLTIVHFRLRIPPIPAMKCSGRLSPVEPKAGVYDLFRPSMTPSRSAPTPEQSNAAATCKHPRVRVVAREEDAEFVECLECGEVFDSSEFKDMGIEETKLK